MRSLRAVLAAAVLFLPRVCTGQADRAAVGRIMDEGKTHTQFMRELPSLTTRIGPRLTSSPQLEKAYAWTQRTFKRFGCKNVHLEEWGEYPLGFERGKTQI